jgi:uncharacterized protein (TIGR02678 family)
MGIPEFDSKLEYILLCTTLIYLEDKIKGEQFILSGLTEFIETVLLNIDSNNITIDWTLYKNRKSMVKVLKFIEKLYFIIPKDGDAEKFSDSMESETLYDITGLSKYFAKNFLGNVYSYNNYKDVEEGEWIGLEQDRGLARRHRVYRRLVMTPSIYFTQSDDPDYMYIKSYKNVIAKDLEDLMDSNLHIYKNLAMLVLGDTKNYKDTFPNTSAISDIVLQLNSKILMLLAENKIVLKQNDLIEISNLDFRKILNELKEENSLGWSKEYREITFEKLEKNVIDYMINFNFIELDETNMNIKIYPTIAKVIGEYPKDFDIRRNIND